MAGVLSSVNWAGIVSNFVFWAGLGIIGLLMLVVALFVWYRTSFPYTLTYWQVSGSGQDGYTVDKARKTRVKWSFNRTYWITMHPWFNKKKVEPFDNKWIYPGQSLYAFKVGDDFVPAKINLGSDSSKFTVEPIPYHVRNWQIMALKQNQIEFSDKSFWDENKTIIMAVIAVAICCALAALTIYYTYSFASTSLDNNALKIGEMTQAIKEALVNVR